MSSLGIKTIRAQNKRTCCSVSDSSKWALKFTAAVVVFAVILYSASLGIIERLAGWLVGLPKPSFSGLERILWEYQPSTVPFLGRLWTGLRQTESWVYYLFTAFGTANNIIEMNKKGLAAMIGYCTGWLMMVHAGFLQIEQNMSFNARIELTNLRTKKNSCKQQFFVSLQQTYSILQRSNPQEIPNKSPW